MPGEGITSVFSAALGYVPTLFTYFSPSKSPYYSMTVAGIAAICILMLFESAAWIAALVPIGVVLLILAVVTMNSPRFQFSIDEYNDQLKFARSLAITTAIVCLAFIVHNPRNPLGYGPLSAPADAHPPQTVSAETQGDTYLQYAIIGVYVVCILQIVLFLAYAFVFEGYDETVQALAAGDGSRRRLKVERNYVQVALVMCAYLAGMTIITNHMEKSSTFQIDTVAFFAAIWLTCAIQVLLFIRSNFSLAPPVDVIRPLQPQTANVITLRQLDPVTAGKPAFPAQLSEDAPLLRHDSPSNRT